MQAQSSTSPGSKDSTPARQLLRPGSFQGPSRAAGMDMPRRLSVPSLPAHRTALQRPQQAPSIPLANHILPGGFRHGMSGLASLPEPSIGPEGDDLTAVSSSVTITEGESVEDQPAMPDSPGIAAGPSQSSAACWRRVPANPEVCFMWKPHTCCWLPGCPCLTLHCSGLGIGIGYKASSLVSSEIHSTCLKCQNAGSLS